MEVAMKSIQRILFATDFSSASGKAFDRAIDLAKDNGAQLTVAHVYEPPSRLSLDGYVLPQVYDEFEAALREEAEKQLAPLVSRAAKAGVQAQSLLVKGIPYRAIARAAKTSNADLVVLGTHGRTGVARLFLGSVAARVISTAPCPVLTVRAA
jgi:nucleotide-binding universal stress UspA family protein